MISHYRYRGPSRILWFLIGAATASWLLKPNSDSRIFGHCKRLQYQTPPPNSSLPDGALSDGAHFTPSAPNSCEQQQSWQHEKEHLANTTRKVTDILTDLTEATLESVVCAAGALIGKLKEHRANREQQQSIIEETRNSPPPA